MLNRLGVAVEHSLFYLDLISKLEIPLKIALEQIAANPPDLANRLHWLISEADSAFECCVAELQFELNYIAVEIKSLEQEQEHE